MVDWKVDWLVQLLERTKVYYAAGKMDFREVECLEKKSASQLAVMMVVLMELSRVGMTEQEMAALLGP